MTTYVKGEVVENATSYELLERVEAANGELLDFVNATNAPASWAYDEATQTWKMTNANYENLRWDIALEAGTVYLVKYTFSELSGNAQATIRDSANTTLKTISTNGAPGTYEAEFTPSESGTYSFRICGIGETCSGTLSTASVAPVEQEEGQDVVYTSLATATEINFDVSALGLTAGNHTLVVKAKAEGFEDSDYSNEVVYTAT